MKCLWIGLFLLLISNFPLHSKIIDGVAAIVNNDIITISELNQKLLPYKEKLDSLNLPKSEKEKELEKLRKKILSDMINNRLIEQFGKKLGYTVTDKEVDQVIEDILKRNNITIFDLKEALKAKHISYKSYREQIRREILVARVINSYVRKNIKIPKEEIEKYIKTHFKRDEETQYHIMQILFLRKDITQRKLALINKILNELKNKKASFKELAKKYSEGPFKDNGGDLGFFKKSELLPQIRKVIESMKPGDIKVVKTKYGIHIIKLVEVKSKNQNLTVLMKKAEEILKNKLFDKKYKEWIQELRKNALIIVKI